MPLEDTPSKWTVETVKSTLTESIVALAAIQTERDVRYQQRFEAQQRELGEFKTTTEERFKGVNEFRGALADAQRELMPRREAEAVLAASATDRAALRELVSENRVAVNEQVASMKTATDVQIAALKASIEAMHAKGTGMKDGWGWAVAVVMFAIAVYMMIRSGGAP